MKTGKKLLTLLAVVCLFVHFAVPSALAADAAVAAGTADLTVASSTSGENTSVIAFAGYEWYVIGYNGSGVYSTSGDKSVTLLAKENEFGTSAFRNGTGSSYAGFSPYTDAGWTYYYADSWKDTPNEYGDSTLQKKMEDIALGFPDAEESLIIPRDISAGINGDTVSAQKLWAISGDEWDTIGNTNVRSYND